MVYSCILAIHWYVFKALLGCYYPPQVPYEHWDTKFNMTFPYMDVVNLGMGIYLEYNPDSD